MPKRAIIIGAGPAGLTSAYELLTKTDVIPIIYESTGDIGGISKTVNFKGNRIDIGGHRFFSKSDRVMEWWLNIFPQIPDPETTDAAMLVRNRLSRIFFMRRFFNYPISINLRLFKALGAKRTFKIGLSYIRARLFPIKKEKNLEEFFINRFGRELYSTFFKDYTEKVWGVSCGSIKPEWGSQRVKGLSVAKALSQAFRKMILPRERSIAQKGTETSLIDTFLYPKYGPGQFWEHTASLIIKKGGQIKTRTTCVGMISEGGGIKSVKLRDENTGRIFTEEADYYFSSMPIKDLIAGFEDDVPPDVRKTADSLMYRDFITVGLLLKKLKIKNDTNIKTENGLIPDNWIYIQERDVRLGRIQVFNNWSPYMVKDKNTVWLGLEYFCNIGDDLWNKSDDEFAEFASSELAKIGIIDMNDVIDSTVIRMPKTYPAYFGGYEDFSVVRGFLDKFENLFLIGRNGMHKYNNTDHSMMTAMVAVENIINDIKTKDNIWDVNTEKEYLEDKSTIARSS